MPSSAMFPLYKSKPFIDKQLKLIVYVIIFMLFLKKFKPDILLLLWCKVQQAKQGLSNEACNMISIPVEI